MPWQVAQPIAKISAKFTSRVYGKSEQSIQVMNHSLLLLHYCEILGDYKQGL
jgi:hypothetical protein